VPVIAQSARFSRTPADHHAAPRRLGADTVSVLHELGCPDSEIEDLARDGVI
jgi:crotonobetainyl-CoA:carnitine CoA-transferase CaiB-like acyl-CoA transferase